MTALLGEIAGRGYPLSPLYPATMPLYRSLGWELAGSRDTVVIPARSLLRPLPPDPGATRDDAPPAADLRRVGPDDAAAVVATLGRVHAAARDCGPVTRDVAMAAQWLADRDVYAYLAGDGFLAYQWQRHDLFVERAEAISGPAIRAFWAHVGSHASIADKIYARTGPASAFWWLTAERDADIAHRSRWMLRVVDAPAAIAARGFPEVVSARIVLGIDDRARPANSGLWELAIADGVGALIPVEPSLTSAALTLGARGLAALYAGTPVGTLRQAGLACGGTPDGDEALDAAFAATAFMLDAF